MDICHTKMWLFDTIWQTISFKYLIWTHFVISMCVMNTRVNIALYYINDEIFSSVMQLVEQRDFYELSLRVRFSKKNDCFSSKCDDFSMISGCSLYKSADIYSRETTFSQAGAGLVSWTRKVEFVINKNINLPESCFWSAVLKFPTNGWDLGFNSEDKKQSAHPKVAVPSFLSFRHRRNKWTIFLTQKEN